MDGSGRVLDDFNFKVVISTLRSKKKESKEIEGRDSSGRGGGGVGTNFLSTWNKSIENTHTAEAHSYTQCVWRRQVFSFLEEEAETKSPSLSSPLLSFSLPPLAIIFSLSLFRFYDSKAQSRRLLLLLLLITVK